MPTDLACKPCEGTGWYPKRTDSCSFCAGSGVAAWAIEAFYGVAADEFSTDPGDPEVHDYIMGRIRDGLAAVREEAKNQ